MKIAEKAVHYNKCELSTQPEMIRLSAEFFIECKSFQTQKHFVCCIQSIDCLITENIVPLPRLLDLVNIKMN